MFKNHWQGVGHAGNDAGAVRKAGTKDVASFRLAVSNGKDVEPEWFTVEGWERLAERAASVKKGDFVGVSGRIKQETYTDKAGAKQTVVKVIADDIAFLGRKSDASNDSDDDGGVY